MNESSLVGALSETERDEFRHLFDKRLEKIRARTADCFAFRDVEAPHFWSTARRTGDSGMTRRTSPRDCLTIPP